MADDLSLMDYLTETGAIKLFTKLLGTDIYGKIKTAGLKRKIKQLNIEDTYKTACNVSKVKTIWQYNNEVDLHTFYHPTTVCMNRNRDQIILESLNDFPSEGKYVVQGTAGQGKSILLRYLTSRGLKEGNEFPIFVELRKVSDKLSLEDLLILSLREMGIELSPNEILELLGTGRCSLILDAFDEIPSDQVKGVITQIESWCNQFHRLRIIVSSRPNAHIQQSSYFRVLNIKELDSADYQPILEKLYDGQKDKVEPLLKAIHGKSNEVSNLITTPLLLTLFAIEYEAYDEIPSDLSDFYKRLFHIMCSRHDKLKPGYEREFVSGLNESNLKSFFEAFSFECMKAKTTSMDFEKANNICNEASKLPNIPEVCGEDFLSDMVKATCLLLEEGGELHYIHKSIREYFAASFLKNAPESLKTKFYKFSASNYPIFQGELEFLSSLDGFMYNKHFLLPVLEEYLNVVSLEYYFPKSMDLHITNGMINSYTMHNISRFFDRVEGLIPTSRFRFDTLAKVALDTHWVQTSKEDKTTISFQQLCEYGNNRELIEKAFRNKLDEDKKYRKLILDQVAENEKTLEELNF